MDSEEKKHLKLTPLEKLQQVNRPSIFDKHKFKYKPVDALDFRGAIPKIVMRSTKKTNNYYKDYIYGRKTPLRLLEKTTTGEIAPYASLELNLDRESLN